MAPEERLEGRRLVPSHKHLAVGVAEETADIGADKAHARHGEGEAHRHGGLQVPPVRGVIPGPDSSVPGHYRYKMEKNGTVFRIRLSYIRTGSSFCYSFFYYQKYISPNNDYFVFF